MTPTTMQENLPIISIEGQEVQLMKYRDQPVVTLRMIDELHQRAEGTARRNFNENRKHFIENEDYFEIPFEEWSKFLVVRNSYDQNSGGHRGSMTFPTESGYLLLVKSFNDDLAWKVQRQLIKCYFRCREAISGGMSDGPHRKAFDASVAKRHALGIKIARDTLKMGKEFGVDLYEAKVRACEEATKISGIDFTHLVPLIPRQGRKGGGSETTSGISDSGRSYRGDDLADKFFSALKDLPPKQREKCVYVREDFIFVRMPLALKLIEARGLRIAQADLTPALKKHEAFMKASAVVHARFGQPKSFVVRVWSFSHAIFA